MEERKMIAEEFIGAGYPKNKVLEILKISKSSYYFKPVENSKSRGRANSTTTLNTNGISVSNSIVIENIKEILSEEFVDYGYLKTTYALRQDYDYIINHKKVYRLMLESGLINLPNNPNRKGRIWVKDLVPQTFTCFNYIEFDIKSVFIKGMGRNALIVTAIDVYSRWVLGQTMAWKINKNDIITLFEKLFNAYPWPKQIIIRNDNGSQMVAQKVQEFFQKNNVIQEFTKPATPEQNAHIESYHSILERTICQRYEFKNLLEATDTFTRFVKFYNYRRIHSGIGYISPYKFIQSKGITLNIEPEIFEAKKQDKNGY